MNFKTTILLVVLLLVVGAYFFYVERNQTTTAQRETAKAEQGKEKGQPLFATDAPSGDSVASFTIERPGQLAVQITKVGNEWFQTKPVRFALNNYSAKGVIDEVAALRQSESFKPGDKDAPTLESVSLATPLVTLTLTPSDSKKKPQIIKLGRKSIGGFGYVALEGDPKIYVVTDNAHRQLLDGKLSDWRRKSLTGPTDGQAQSVTLTASGTRVEMVKAENNWTFTGSHSGRVGADALRSLLSQVKSTYITKFVADEIKDPAVYGLDKPTLVLRTIVPPVPPAPPAPPAATQPGDNPGEKNAEQATEKPKVYTLTVGAPAELKKDDYFATYTEDDEPAAVVFTLIRSEVEKLTKSIDDLRDARLTTLGAPDVRELSIDRPKQSALKLLRGPMGWSFADGGPSFKADSGLVSDLVQLIVDAKASGYRADAKPEGEATAVLTLGATGRSEPDVLRVFAVPGASSGPKVEPKLLVMRNQETTGHLIDASKLSKVLEPAISLRERLVLDLNRNLVSRITVRRRGESAGEFVFERELPPAAVATSQPSTKPAQPPGPWKMKGQEKFEESAVKALLDQVATLRTEKWIEASIPTNHATISTTVMLTNQDGSNVTLWINPDTESTKATGIDGEFFAPKTLLDAVNAEFRDRTVLAVALSEIKSVEVAGLVVTRDDDGKFAGASGEKVSQSAAGALFDTLAGLRVERYVGSAVGLPVRTLKITTTDGKTRTLNLLGLGGQSRTASLDGRWFVLEESTLTKLKADLLQKEPERGSNSGGGAGSGSMGLEEFN
jgi:hypothetical protein